MTRRVPILLVVAGLLCLSTSAWAGVVAPHSTYMGKTLGDWGRDWWIWAQSIPEITSNNGMPNPIYEHPLYDNDGSVAYKGNVGNAFYLGGVYRLVTDPPNPEKITRVRSATVKAGQPIFFPMLNAFTSAGRPDRPQDDAGIIARTVNSVNGVTNVYANIDGVAVPNPFDHREAASGVFDVTFGPDNIYGVPTDRQGVPWHSYSDGYWIMLEPLSFGNHTINFGGAVGTAFVFDVTYNIDVVPTPNAAAVLAAGLPALLLRRRRGSL